MARRRRPPVVSPSPPSSLPEVFVPELDSDDTVPRHHGLPFDDSTDSPGLRSGYTPTPARRYVVRLAPPPLARRPAVVSLRSVFRGVGSPRMLRNRLGVPSGSRREPPPPSKGRLLFNVLQTPFSRRARHCVARHVRRSVLFALRKRGRINPRSPGGAGGYRRTASSQWRC